jgi:DNA-binding NarL/FixJ family response regulator
VLVHTRHASEADLEWAFDAGCDRIVPKSAPEEILLRRVRRLDVIAASHAPRASDLGVVNGADGAGRGARGTDAGDWNRSAQSRERDL